jgi:hypothetical protein
VYDDYGFLSEGFLHGQATTLIVMGLPLVLLGRHLPERIQQAAEVNDRAYRRGARGPSARAVAARRLPCSSSYLRKW